MISPTHHQSPIKNNIPTNTILYDLTCLMEELGQHEHMLNEKIDEKYLSTQEIEDEDNQYISFEQDKIFDKLFSKASYYDDFVQFQTRPTKEQDKQSIQKSKKSLVQNDSQRRIIQMAQYFQEIRKSFQSHKSKFKSTMQLYSDTISQRQDITFQIDHKQTLINQLSDLYKNNQKILQKTNQSLKIQCQELEIQISNEMIEENKIRIKYQLSRLIFNDNQLMDTLQEIQGLDDNQLFDQSQELVEIFNEAMSLVSKLKKSFNIQQEKKNINDYLQLLKSKNAQLQQDSKKVQDLLTSGLEFSQSINSQNYQVQQLSVQYLFEVHNDPFYKQKQLKIVQEQFNYFENTIKKFVNYLDQIKTDGDSAIKIQEAIQNNVSKKESINRINLEITNIQNKLKNSTGEETQSKLKDKAQGEQEIEQSTRTYHQLKKLLELKQQRIQQLQTKIDNKKKRRQEKKQRKTQKKRVAEQSKNITNELFKSTVKQSSKSKVANQSNNNSKSKPLSKIRQQQHSDKSVSSFIDKKLSKPKKRSTVMKKK